MFGLAFRFPAGRYHATSWGRNVNEADVAWPPEPWRILRALIACYWRKGDRQRWDEEDLARLMEDLSEELPVFHLPEGGVHAHSRHYMPIRKGKEESKTLVFDAFLHIPHDAEVQVVWGNVTLNESLLGLVTDLVAGMAYLGRAESWTECRTMTEPEKAPNCQPAEPGHPDRSEGMGSTGSTDGEAWELCRLLAPRSAASYRAVRERLIRQETDRVRASSEQRLSENALRKKVERSFRAKGGADTLPARLVDALSLDTADCRDRKWSLPPAAREVVYACTPEAVPGVVARTRRRPRSSLPGRASPTVARFLLAGRPLPRIEDAVRIGELMRRAALAQFGWRHDADAGRWIPKAPREISGRDCDGKPLRDPSHSHAFWLPEDADGDGWVDHVSVYIAGGMNDSVRRALDRITRLWLSPKQRSLGDEAEPGSVKEWRLALEGFGRPADFAGGARIFATSRTWRSVTPFLAAGHLKADGYRGEVSRVLQRRGRTAAGIEVGELATIDVGGTPRRAVHFHRFRSRGREAQPDAAGALLDIVLPEEIEGPLAIGYGSHFGLGLFVAAGGGLP